ncbi:MAG: D-arabinono-1,4-lactone oxidase [Myxococcota bacterium]|nr:D-arabinono-1,4-lactone oxidase [Myxococcota bacterium]
MAEWQNWSGRLRAHPAQIVSPADEAELIRSVERAHVADSPIGIMGRSHSHSPLVPTDGLLLDLSGFSGVIEVDAKAGWACMRAGTPLSELGLPLRESGAALMNQGDIDRQTLAGSLATGTHGTGHTLQNLSASLLRARLILADGSAVECSATEEPDLFEVARLGLGAVGVMTELTLRVRKAYRLQEKLWLEDLDSVLERVDDLVRDHRHFEFFWMPGSARAACKTLTETEEEPVYPLAEEGKRRAWSYEVLANERNDHHSEMEYSVAEENGPACIRALREMLSREFPDLAWPLEYRTVREDDIWISSARGRPTVTISVHQGVDHPDEPLFRASEAIFRHYDGRPHWGKVHFMKGRDFARIHPRWQDWWRIRDQYDPKQLFLNSHLRELRSHAD